MNQVHRQPARNGAFRFFAVAFAFSMAGVAAARSQEGPPAWAYPVNPPDLKPTPDDGTLRHVPDSNASYTLTQVSDRFFAPDWHPGDHPPLPESVARGRKPDVFACGFCHRADGAGGPENASLAGLPAEYIIQQVADFKSGARKSSVPARPPVRLMASVSTGVSDAELQAAAAYFSALKPKVVIKVVETDTVPKTFVPGWHLAATPDGEKEPIGARLIEIPASLADFTSRDSRTGFIAYAPIGSIQKGKLLANSGGDGKTLPCATCHGPDLKGVGPIPGIAGRSPSYMVRQLYDVQHGARAGSTGAPMKLVVEKLDTGDMIALAAYAASLEP
jgi:cytochrome c553